MLTPSKVFFSSMLVVALMPIPILNSAIAFAATWAVLGFRKGLIVLAASFSYNVFTSLAFMETLWQSLMAQFHQAIVLSPCTSTSCYAVNEAAFAPMQVELFAMLRADAIVIAVIVPLTICSFVPLWLMVRRVRKYSSGIRRYYWGKTK